MLLECLHFGTTFFAILPLRAQRNYNLFTASKNAPSTIPPKHLAAPPPALSPGIPAPAEICQRLRHQVRRPAVRRHGRVRQREADLNEGDQDGGAVRGQVPDKQG